jgi:hypothetical protein
LQIDRRLFFIFYSIMKTKTSHLRREIQNKLLVIILHNF